MASAATSTSIIRLTNCILVSDGVKRQDDLYINQTTGKIVESTSHRDQTTVTTLDLGGRIVSPGLIDVQLNGAVGFNFSEVPDDDVSMIQYNEGFIKCCQKLIETGVTSFLPTVVTAESDRFRRVLPYLAPNGYLRDHSKGSESLGAHCEGPFLSLGRRGAHAEKHIVTADAKARSIREYYGCDNFKQRAPGQPAAIKKITVAPESLNMCDAIRTITHDEGIIVSMGHSMATYEQGLEGLAAGATMITHLFNAMEPYLHRTPGLAGLIGAPESDIRSLGDGRLQRPYFGLIADDVHVHPACVRAAWATHEDGCILTTDGTAATGMQLKDGVYEWSHGRRFVKSGRKLFLEGTETIAGGTSTLLQCVSNLIRWAGIDEAKALKTVTTNPAAMLGLKCVKGSLDNGADADLVILSWKTVEGLPELVVDEVWKFGIKMYTAEA